MEKQQLIHFKKAAELNNMNRAAALLHTTQPAISKSIRRLEEELGVSLFERQGKKVALNETGREILVHVNKILEEFDEIHNIAATATSTRPVHILAKAADQLVYEMAHSLRIENPLLSIKISHYVSSDGEPDLEITSSLERYEKDDGLTVLKENFSFVVPKGHPFGNLASISLKEAAGEPIVILSEGMPLREIILHWYQVAGVEPRIAYECDTCAAVREMISNGSGIGLVPDKTWNFMDSGRVRSIPVRDPECYRYVNVVCTNPEDKAVAKVYQNIVSRFSRL